MDEASPRELFHYTSIEKFFKIVTNKSLWLFDIHKLNDSEEVIYFVKQYSEKWFREVCKEKNIEFSQDDCDNLYLYPDKPYIFCMSEARDLLSQWRGYADDGYGVSLGLSYSELFKMQNLSSNVMLNKIQYGQDFSHITFDIRKEIEDYLINKNPAIYQHIKLALSILGTWHKNDAFIEEKEWRLVFNSTYHSDSMCYDNSEDEYKMNCLQFLPVRGDFRGYYALSISEKANVITSVRLGPKCKCTLSEMRDFLMTNGFDNVDISRSTIPYI